MPDRPDPIASLAARISLEIGAELPVTAGALAVMRGYKLARAGQPYSGPQMPVFFDLSRPGDEQELEIARGCSRLLLLDAMLAPTPAAIDWLAWHLCGVRAPERKRSVSGEYRLTA